MVPEARSWASSMVFGAGLAEFACRANARQCARCVRDQAAASPPRKPPWPTLGHPRDDVLPKDPPSLRERGCSVRGALPRPEPPRGSLADSLTQRRPDSRRPPPQISGLWAGYEPPPESCPSSLCLPGQETLLLAAVAQRRRRSARP